LFLLRQQCDPDDEHTGTDKELHMYRL
jgi:hypothetical protein